MKVTIALLASLIMGCATEVSSPESTAGGSPPSTSFSTGEGGGYHPCGRTQKVYIPLPDGEQRTMEVLVYCRPWEIDKGDPPPDMDVINTMIDPFVLPVPNERKQLE